MRINVFWWTLNKYFGWRKFRLWGGPKDGYLTIYRISFYWFDIEIETRGRQ